ncbi:MAG: fimb protein [Simplicispira suum]|uniref:hypothetical protein n=1 Tax=Simplicispira suum TaxID=2109915 RepID=UPI001C6C6A78|nr:hypothetical protein [Simplicispira suum]MBW7832497.1 fimb protein [Simplicispira suum]
MQNRWRFAFRWALNHLAISTFIALVSAGFVFLLWYPMPYRTLLGVGGIYLIILIVDVACGPLMTFVLASPRKSRREMVLDLSLVAVIQAVALAYGMHAVWVARPVVLAFENDRFTVVSANELDAADLANAPLGLQELPIIGVLKVSTRKPRSNAELFGSVELSLAGISPAMRPSWWQPMADQHAAMRERAKPLRELITRRPAQRLVLENTARTAGYPVEVLVYLPLTSSKTKEWVALLNESLEMVGYAPVDGFE